MNRYNSLKDLQILSETALDSSLAGFWDWNMVTNEEYLSPRFKEMFGYQDHEMENKPESWQKIAFQEDLPLMFKSFEEHVKSHGKIPFKSIVRYYHKNGDTIWVRCNGKVVEWSDDGAPLRAIGCHVDITEEKQLQSELEQALQEREILLKEVHHRVKNNLQLLLSIARLKNKNGKIETAEIEDSINSISSAYEAIYRSNRFDDISFTEYVEQILEPLVALYKLDLELKTFEVKGGIDFLIPLGLIISEFVNNSVKYAFKGQKIKKITLTIAEVNGKLEITYSDNGPGYDLKTLESIDELESFGLTIIKSLIDQLGGTISFYNENGACAKICIP